MEKDNTAGQDLARSPRPRVVIIGAGFGGLWAARRLRRAHVDITLIDQNNYHIFLPLLYQVAAAEVEPEAIVSPVRSIVRRQWNAQFVLGEVTDIDLTDRRVRAGERSFLYDYLIIATGSRSQFFGIPGADEHTFPLKSLEQGIALRNHILCCFEKAALETNPSAKARLLTFVIVGAGPTGVEFAGALSELVRKPIARDHHWLRKGDVRIVLVEAADRVLATMPDRLGRYATQHLEEMGVEVRASTRVVGVTPDSVELSGAGAIRTNTTIWTAGVGGDPPPSRKVLPLGRANRVTVGETLQVAEYSEVYVVGDSAIAEGESAQAMVAPVAIQQGAHAADNIVRQMKGRPATAFKYFDKGTMATIGRNAAVAHIGKVSFTGFPAWLLWLIVHLYSLIGFRNRIVVLLSWAWDYLFLDRPIRLIMSPAAGPASETINPPSPCSMDGTSPSRKEPAHVSER